MKKSNIIKNIITFKNFFLVTLCLCVTFLSCEIGLGPAVDITAPEVWLTSHNDNDSVGQTFVLRGVATDNEGVTKLTIDFDDADIHYQISSDGSWQKRTSTTSWQTMTSTSSEPYTCTFGKEWNWAIFVDTQDKKSSYSDSTFTFSIEAQDEMGNSGRKSKADYALNVDENLPVVSVIKPDIFSNYDSVETSCKSYKLQNANSLSHLINGDFTITGRQSAAISFRELLIEFDDGTTSPTGVNGTGNSYTTAQELSDSNTFERGKVYYSKTFKVGNDGITDLRTWSLTVKQNEWVTEKLNSELLSSDLENGKNLIRVVSTSVTSANAYERKVLGWFIWCPEADTPWVSTQIGSDELSQIQNFTVYPSSAISGQAYDDDGIASLSYSVKKRSLNDSFEVYDSKENVSLALSEAKAKSSQWSFYSPSELGEYCITLNIKDLNGKEYSITRYFTVLDVRPPSVELSSPISGSSILEYSDAKNITFEGIVEDDGSIKNNALYIAFLNPNNNDPTSKIKYQEPATDWSSASESGFIDSDGNKLYKITLDSPTYNFSTKLYSYGFKKTFNIFTDLGIGNEENGKTLSSLDFVIRTDDTADLNKIFSINILGDTEAPTLTFEKIKLVNSSGANVYPSSGEFEFDGSTIPTFPKIENGYRAILSGKWSDNSTSKWNDISKLKENQIIWNGIQKGTMTLESNGTWTATITDLPTSSGVIEVRLTDLGGNTKSVTQSVFIDSSNAQLERLSSDNDDGSYGFGKTINIYLEFTKNTSVTGTPVLQLNNGKTATWDSSTNNSAKHKFTYTIAEDDTNTDGTSGLTKLLVTNISAQSGTLTWKDASNETEFTVTLPTDSTKTLATRNIIVDTKAPKVKDIYTYSQDGSYKSGSQIFLLMEFSENVTITGVSNLKLNFNHSASTDGATAQVSGSRYVIMPYTVASGHNSQKLTLSSITANNVSVEDEAGNSLTDWQNLSSGSKIASYVPKKSGSAGDSSLVIDTTVPSIPTVTKSKDWANVGENIITGESADIYFTVSGEEGATIEYTTDGTNYQTYSGKVTLKNNGKYTVKARQTDKAGNLSSEGVGAGNTKFYTVTIDRGDLLTSISSENYSGTYKTGTEIIGKINFRKTVTIPQNATVTLNVLRNNVVLDAIPIEECKDSNASATSFTFKYTVAENDAVDTNGNSQGYLNLKSWSISTVTVDGVSTALDFTSDVVNAGKNLTNNRNIKILAGYPKVTGVSLSSDNETLTLKFDREISKVSSTEKITLEMIEDFKAPAVLSVNDYNDLITEGLAIETYYTEGVNGANKSETHLVNDTTTKYVLNYATEDTDTTLVGIFKDKGKNKVEIPLYASNVKQGTSTSLEVHLTGLYVLPVKGATYKLTLPEGIVKDSARNLNTSYVTNGSSVAHLVSSGVEPPVIRIQKNGQTIISTGLAKTASVTMPDTAKMKITSQTPDASIKYSKNEKTSDAKTIKDAKTHIEKDLTTTDVTYPSSAVTTYNSEVTLGGAVSNYDSASGLKIAIAATSTKGSSSETAYEYATRTVLKFDFATSGYDTNQGYASCTVDSGTVNSGSTTANMYNLPIWIQGGDSPAGGNSISGFPLSWADCSTYKLMKCDDTDWTSDGSWQGNHTYWYWITWDLSSVAYTGFVAGDVPSDATTASGAKGPKNWYVGECSWAAIKENTALYPGETLILSLDGVDNNDDNNNPKGTYFFRTKNHGSR